MIREINVETGEIQEREYTKAEQDLADKTRQDFLMQLQAEAEAKAARAILLAKLGISEEEAKLLLG